MDRRPSDQGQQNPKLLYHLGLLKDTAACRVTAISAFPDQPPSSIPLTGYQPGSARPLTWDDMDSNSPATSSTGPKLDPMKISSVINPALGTEGYGISVPRSNKHSDIEYCLKICQQPVAARSCGFGEKDRRVIDPPPITQLTIKGPDPTEKDIDMLLHDQ
ncbi:uncharacterized protein FTOL_12377 [Fusarium torulosum]|uniref:Velvet domain-containing protein n=1 Tax=Fusarium torulosum TaxID=33205 RepID=A0AAE8SP62_9HYPO|nr:uncharacterized protein FTOL_12377 [Fusarium torulosum]